LSTASRGSKTACRPFGEPSRCRSVASSSSITTCMSWCGQIWTLRTSRITWTGRLNGQSWKHPQARLECIRWVRSSAARATALSSMRPSVAWWAALRFVSHSAYRAGLRELILGDDSARRAFACGPIRLPDPRRLSARCSGGVRHHAIYGLAAGGHRA
jgi:hypothetical protein